jgi:hypothetical protein
LGDVIVVIVVEWKRVRWRRLSPCGTSIHSVDARRGTFFGLAD